MGFKGLKTGTLDNKFRFRYPAGKFDPTIPCKCYARFVEKDDEINYEILEFFPEEHYNEETDKYLQDANHSEMDKIKFFGRFHECHIDPQGRVMLGVNICSRFKRYSEDNGKLAIVGMGKSFAIMSKTIYDKLQTNDTSKTDKPGDGKPGRVEVR